MKHVKIDKYVIAYKKEKILKAQIAKACKEIVDLTHKHGGATYHINHGNMVGMNKYAVSCHKQHESILDTRMFPLNVGLLQLYYHFHGDLLIPKKYSKVNYCLGTWHDVKHGKTYIDVVRLVQDKDKALELAKKHHQEAIFDLNKMKEIYVSKEK